MSLGRVLICKESIQWAMIKKGRRNGKKESACPHAFFFWREIQTRNLFCNNFILLNLHSACGNITIFIKWYSVHYQGLKLQCMNFSFLSLALPQNLCFSSKHS